MSSFILRLDAPGTGLRVAVKDNIDVAGLPTTAGSRARADEPPAAADAPCLAGLRTAVTAGTARLIGKTNLHELALGVTGINPWFGTPVNPLDATRVPGGSSSGSATAVAAGEADVAFGTDTGGSVRIPAACCGVVGLKTTWDRISIQGIWPLAPSLDTVGPIAREVTGAVAGMRLLEPAFAPGRTATRIGWIPGPARPEIVQAIAAAFAACELSVVSARLTGWSEADRAGKQWLVREAWETDRALLERRGEVIGADVRERLIGGSRVSEADRAWAERCRTAWIGELARVFAEVDLIATPTLTDFPPTLDQARVMHDIRRTVPVNLAGLPALALPIPTGSFPCSVQLIGPAGSEEMLVATGLLIEQAVLT